MPEIGETLREARMRRRIDMTEVEAATKIRAKYLRALENEEWDLLPGPTFVKTFLRTYAEYLELDPRMLVEEYRQRYERPSTQDLTPFGPGPGRGRRRQRPRRSLGPLFVVLFGVLALLGALYLLGVVGATRPTTGGRRSPRPRRPRPPPAKTAADDEEEKEGGRPRGHRCGSPRTARVYVCLVDATGKAVVNGQYLEPGKSTRTFRSQRFRMNLGNSEVTLRVGGKRYSAANIGNPIGYEVRAGKKPTRLLGEPHAETACAT